MVDEAHATGICGAEGRGLAEELGLLDKIEIQMGTLGKALGSSGGYICGSRVLVDFLLNRARSFVFSTAPVPASTAAATAAIRFIQTAQGKERRRQLWDRITQLNAGLKCLGATLPIPVENQSAILPLIIGRETEALQAAKNLFDQGLYVPAIRYPTVARGQARLRITLSAAHTANDVSRLLLSLGLSIYQMAESSRNVR
jgi:7-keto-8-aminopelargonate synthetase-like enzyme